LAELNNYVIINNIFCAEIINCDIDCLAIYAGFYISQDKKLVKSGVAIIII
jgi:hypothetical protein